MEYLSNHDTNVTTLKKSFEYKYELNYKKTVETLITNGYMRIGSAEESLSINTLQELKDFLNSKGLSVTGKKENLIQRIVTETEGYDTHFPKRVFILTEKGQTTINEYENARVSNLKKKISDTIFYIRNGQFERLVPLYESNSDSKNPLSLEYNKDAIIKDALAINEYRNMSHDTDRELAICIVLIMWHCSFRSSVEILKELGYQTITNSEIYTASTSVYSLRNLAEYRECNIKKYKISTCGDNRVCDKCAKHAGKKYLVSKAVIGKNMPPFCAECRCVMIADL